MSSVPHDRPASGGSPSASPSPPPGAKSADETAAVWYVARGGKNQQEGPFSLAALKEQAAAGKLASDDLVWHQGFPSWKPAHEVPGLCESHGSPSAMLQPVAPAGDSVLPGWARKIASLLTHPTFFFITGLVSALLAVLTLFGSLITFILWRRAWWDGIALFLLLFVVCEAACGILEILRRREKAA